MWRRKPLLKWNRNRFGQTFGSAHQESRSLNKTDLASGMFSKSPKNGNVLSEIESQGYRIRRASAPGYLKLIQYPSGNKYQRLNDTSSPNPGLPGERTAGRLCCNRQNPKAKGCRHGSRTQDAAGQNNSNLASLTTSVVNGEWELILAMSSHYCFCTHPSLTPQPPKWGLIIFETSQIHLLNVWRKLILCIKSPNWGI
jgi:hypothetical protein